MAFFSRRNPVQYTAAWNNCINLQELCRTVISFEVIKTIFSTPKEKLNVLKLGFLVMSQAEGVKDMMDLCATGTKCIEKPIVKGPHLYRDSLNKFFEAKKSTLSSVIIIQPEYGPGMEFAVNELDELLDSLFWLWIAKCLKIS